MPFKTSLSPDQVKNIQDAIKKMLSSDAWDKAVVLRVIRQQLQVLSDKFDKAALEAFAPEELAALVTHDEKQLVFISVYASEGKNLEAWQRLIMNLPRQYISRPIYAREEDAQYAARNKGIAMNEGYVAIWVDKSNIMPSSNQLFDLKDKFQHALITLKDRAIDLNNIEFFWVNSIQYTFQNGRLNFLKAVDDFIY
jgi:intracellular multiplication protein IcmQ